MKKIKRVQGMILALALVFIFAASLITLPTSNTVYAAAKKTVLKVKVTGLAKTYPLEKQPGTLIASCIGTTKYVQYKVLLTETKTKKVTTLTKGYTSKISPKKAFTFKLPILKAGQYQVRVYARTYGSKKSYEVIYSQYVMMYNNATTPIGKAKDFDKVNPHYVDPTDPNKKEEWTYWSNQAKNYGKVVFETCATTDIMVNFTACNNAITMANNIQLYSQKGCLNDSDYNLLKEYVTGMKPLVIEFYKWKHSTLSLLNVDNEINSGDFVKAYAKVDLARKNFGFDVNMPTQLKNLSDYIKQQSSSVTPAINRGSSAYLAPGISVYHSYTQPINFDVKESDYPIPTP